jgi:DNA-binding SARP family transcriptional activator
MNDRGKKLHYRLAGAYEQAGQLDKALGIYKKIYSVDISFQDVAQKVQTLGAR